MDLLARQGECCDRRAAIAVQRAQKGPLRRDGQLRRTVVEFGQHRPQSLVVAPHFNPDDALRRRGQHGVHRDGLRDPGRFPEAVQPGDGEEGRVAHTRFELFEPCLHVAAQQAERHIGSQARQLRAPAQRRRPDDRPLGQRFDGLETHGDEGVARILAREHGRNGKAVMADRGNILHAVHSQIDAPVQQGLLQLARE